MVKNHEHKADHCEHEGEQGYSYQDIFSVHLQVYQA
jgi:hypothetical protein